MTTDPPSGGTTDPYAKQTAINTGSQEWLSSYQTIKADFGSLSQYALNMQMASMDLQPAAMRLYHLTELTNQAFRSGMPMFPEGTLAASMLSLNFKDLLTMMNDLHVGMQNTAYAAQTISDSYHLNDDGSSQDLNSLIKMDGVDFAFGMGGTRPSGLAKNIGKTWLDEHPGGYTEAQAGADAGTNAADPNMMGGKVTVTYEGSAYLGTKVTTITYPDGSSIRIEESAGGYGGGGSSYTTTSVIGSDGKVQSSTCQVTTTSGGTTTVVTQTPDKDGVYHDVSKQVTTTSTRADGTKVTTTESSSISNGKSTPSGTQVKTQNTDGSTETDNTTYSTDSQGHTTKTTDKQAVGDNDTDISNQKGDNDPKAVADRDDTTFTHRVMQ
ncbi:hypothetical protein [Rugosimonospora africana]|uniref:Uncharacterized protein n=1 Tax=Rugosimonospora africana TaxID=556532 RepID=A0A8J3VRT1_9ACTN|nr:hypothetical protein [Rugosimonospora africana]GIH16555.1 hypothetical protein Raf01_47270 [Rugosimonospora africana]